MEVSLYPFAVDTIEDSSSIAIIGRRRGGKTHLCKYLMSHVFARDYGRFLVMAGTKDCKLSYGDIVPDMFVHEFNIAKLKAIRDYQNQMITRFERTDLPKEAKVCLVLDDIGADRTIMNSEIIRDLYANSRHYGILLVSLHQYPVQIAPCNRANLDYVILTSFGSSKLTKQYFNEFVNVGTLMQFSFAFQSSTSEMGLVCVIDNTKSPKTISDCVFHFHQEKKDLVPVFDRSTWDWCQESIVTNSDTYESDDDTSSELSDTLFEYEHMKGNIRVVLNTKQKID